MKKILNMGLDVGSTTVKLVLIDQNDEKYLVNIKDIIQNIKNTIFELLSETC